MSVKLFLMKLCINKVCKFYCYGKSKYITYQVCLSEGGL